MKSKIRVLRDGSPGASLMVLYFKGSEAMVERQMDPLKKSAIGFENQNRSN